MSWLQVTGLSYTVQHRRLLGPVDFRLEPGQCLGIVGPNGAGKSTLLRLLSGYLSASQGRISLQGQLIHQLPDRDRARLLASVNPRESLPPFALKVTEYLRLGRAPWQDWLGSWTQADSDALNSAVERTAIQTLLNAGLSELSSGEWQRVQLTRALVQNPRLLLLDEPTSHLDVGAQLQVMRLLKTLRAEGLGLVCVVHDLNLAAQYMDTLLLLHQGQLLAAGTPEQVLKPDLLEQAYGVKLSLQTHAVTGRPLLIPDYC